MKIKTKSDLIIYIIEKYKEISTTEVTSKKVETLHDILWKQDYDSIYRIANAIDRFGLDVLLEVFD